MKKILSLGYLLFSIVLLFYVSLPNFDFPTPPPDSVQSMEPADTESLFRRAYFTNYNRTEVLDWYKKQFEKSNYKNIPLQTYLLNYPPENSGSIIRDQTRSTFLQEIVHPFRETVFVNGYEPAPNDDTNKIIIDGVRWRQKIIIKYIPSNVWMRLVVSLLTLISIYFVYSSYKMVLSNFRKVLKQNLKS